MDSVHSPPRIREWIVLPSPFMIALGLCAIVFTVSSGAIAQPASRPIEVPNSIACPTCRVTIRPIATLGARDVDGALEGQPFEVVVDSRNRYWVSPRNRPPMIFDSSGRFVQLLGAVGDGPGEFRGPAIVRFLVGDSALSLDLRTRRGSVRTAELKVARSLSANWPGQLVGFLPTGRTLVASGYVASPSAAGFPLHFISIDGLEAQVTRDFGKGSGDGLPSLARGKEYMFEWRIGRGGGGTFWTADIGQYRVVNWSATTLDPLVQLARKPEWFQDSSLARPRGGAIPPDPIMQAIAEDESGLLWVAVLAASPTWKEGWLAPPPGTEQKTLGERSLSTTMDLLKLYHTVVEIIDPRTRRLVTTFNTKETLISLLPGRRAALYSEDSNGFPRLQIVQFVLVGR